MARRRLRWCWRGGALQEGGAAAVVVALVVMAERAEEQNVLETGNSKRWIESDDVFVRMGSV
jgi:hypothetical protein